MERQTKIIAFVLLILGALFYWHSLRPAGIKKDCARQAERRHPDSVLGFNAVYEKCLKQRGL